MSSFIEEMDRQRKILEDNDLKAKNAGTIVGRFIEHPYADGAAVYRITAATPTKVSIEVVEIGDAWVLPAWGRSCKIPRVKAEEMLRRRDALANMFRSQDDWWEQLPLGATIHYNNGFNQFVRGVIINHDGSKHMKPTALVGSGWRPYDVATRRLNGSIDYGYHAKKILAGEPFKPNASNIVEHPSNKIRDEDPRKMAPLSLTLPEMTEAEKKIAAVTKHYQAVRDALEIDNGTKAESGDRMKQAMLRAKALLIEFN